MNENSKASGVSRFGRSAPATTAVAPGGSSSSSRKSNSLMVGQAFDSLGQYLGAIGSISLLTREQEIEAAQRIERTGRRLRRKILSAGLALEDAVALQEKVHAGRLPLDRVIRVPLNDTAGKRRTRQILAHNLKTLNHLLEAARKDFAIATSRRKSPDERREAQKRMAAARNKAVRLVEETPLRMPHLSSIVDGLRRISESMSELQRQLARSPTGPGDDVELAAARKRLRRLVRIAGESPRSLARRISQIAELKKQHHAAREDLAVGNLRLVVSIAKRYRNRGLGLLDLVQEGNSGLMRAVDKYDYRRGTKFSTYATWWIRQAITRAISEQSHAIRVPVQTAGRLSDMHVAIHALSHSSGRRPTLEESAKVAGLSPEEAGILLRADRPLLSLNDTALQHDQCDLAQVVPDPSVNDLDHAVDNQLLKSRISQVMEALTPQEREVIRLRFGLHDGYPRSLREVGRVFSVTRERIRQVEVSALEKLRHPARLKNLEGFVETSPQAPPCSRAAAPAKAHRNR